VTDSKRVVAIIALIVGVVALGGAVCIGACGALLAVLGLAMSVAALVIKSVDGQRSRALAIVATVVNVLALIVAIINMAAGFWLMQSGQHPLFRTPTPDTAVEADAGVPALLDWPEDTGTR
jgi:hypothetical protein